MTTAIERLRTSLRSALAEASFDIGRTSEFRWFSTTSYAGRSDETIEPELLRDIYSQATWGDETLRKAKSARVRMPDALKRNLSENLREVLRPYVDPNSDCVGHPIPMTGDRGEVHAPVSSIDSFSEVLTRAAAVLGVDRVAELLDEWVRGEPVRYRECRVAGLTLGHALTPVRGVDIVPLPLSTDELPAGLPWGDHIPPAAYLGHSVVRVECIARPALLRPGVDYLGTVVSVERAGGLDFDTIWDALSLECNAHIDAGLGWRDHGDLSVVVNDEATWGTPNPSWHLSGTRSRWRTSLTTRATTLRLADGVARELSETRIGDLLSSLRNTNARTRLAVARWKKSMNPKGDLTDRFIDLRIALEALLLPGGTNQQLSYTLGVRGAWLVGEGAAGRREAWRILRSAYGAASKLVHGSAIKGDKTTLLTEAQELCRKGILRILDGGQVGDWDGLILDAL